MKRLCLLGALAILQAAEAAKGQSGPNDRVATPPFSVVSQPNPKARPVPIADLFYSHVVYSPALSPNGREVVFTADFTGRFNLWKTELDGSMPIQLLESDESQDTPVWSPDGKWIVFRQDTGGDELYDLYAVPSEGGGPVNLTHTADVSEDAALFSPDGRLLAITIKPKASATADVAVMSWRTHEIRKLTHEQSPDHLWQIIGWSADGNYVFGNRVKESYTDADIYMVNVANGTSRNLTPHTGDAMYTGTSVSRSGDILFSSTARGGYQNVGLLHVASGKIDWITDTQWEATAGNFSGDGRYFTYQLNRDGRADLYLQEGRSGTARKVAFPDGQSSDVGIPTSFTSDGSRLLVYHEDAQHPPDLWVYDLHTHKAKQLTHSALASLSPLSVPPSQLVHYKSFDGAMISAYVWIPFNLKRNGSNPVVVLPHGGPTGQTVDKFNTVAAALASRGIICISPNVRGSTGYGIAFQKANIKDLGGGDLQDEIYASRFLVTSGYADPRRIGITGESYGGYVTLLAVSKTPEVWSAAASEYGIVDWRSMLQHTDPRLGEYVKSLLGDPVTDHKVYEAASPITYLAQVRAPLLLLQGENDPRVPKEEAQQVFDALRMAGKTVELHIYPQEGHGFQKRENRIDALNRIVDWFTKYLTR